MAIDSFEVTIIGAGAIGLAAASALASTGRRVLIVESNRSFGQETSSRNSEVIHAGICHPPGFLKTSLCVSGNRLLYAFCEKHDIPHRRVGKIIVAMDDNEIETLEDLKIQGESNGVEGLDLIGKKSI